MDQENTKKLYLLACFDPNTQNSLSDLYENLRAQGFTGKQTPDIPYHFTLGSYEVNQVEQVNAELNRLCAQTACIDIVMSHIGLFGLNVLFIEPNLNFELLELHRGFFPGGGHGCHDWAAHATLLMDEPDVLRALPIVAGHFKPFCARIERVALYEFFPAKLICECELKS